MPVQAGDFDVGGVIDLGLQPQNYCAHDSGNQQDMGAVMKATQAKLAGKSADGKVVSEAVKAKLS